MFEQFSILTLPIVIGIALGVTVITLATLVLVVKKLLTAFKTTVVITAESLSDMIVLVLCMPFNCIAGYFKKMLETMKVKRSQKTWKEILDSMKDDKAISPVIGALMMVLITVLLIVFIWLIATSDTQRSMETIRDNYKIVIP